MNLLPGDVFATKNPQGIGKAICLFEKFTSQDGEAKYGHTGIIQDSTGKTLEAVWTISEQDLFAAYAGCECLIARYKKMDDQALKNGLSSVLPFKGRKYPAQRIVLHFLGLARWVHWFKTPVCSELTALFLISAGADLYCRKNYWGVNPDNMVDDWSHNKDFEIVFEGELK